VGNATTVDHYEPRQAVFMQGVVNHRIYVVRSGLLSLNYLKEDGSEWIKSFVYEGRFFASVMALAPQGRTSFMVRAIESSVLESVDYRLLEKLAAQHLAWSEVLRKLTMLFAISKEQRERELLTLNAQARYTAFRDANPDLAKRIPQKDLARFLGLTPVGLNRIIARVRRDEGEFEEQ
jgi:CRP-like cAMP-binding protein